MPWARIGRSISTTPWSKAMSMTRAAMMHSRPPALVHANLGAVPDPRAAAEVQLGVAPDLDRHAGADEAQPVGLQAAAEARLEPQPARDELGVVARQIG